MVFNSVPLATDFLIHSKFLQVSVFGGYTDERGDAARNSMSLLEALHDQERTLEVGRVTGFQFIISHHNHSLSLSPAIIITHQHCQHLSVICPQLVEFCVGPYNTRKNKEGKNEAILIGTCCVFHQTCVRVRYITHVCLVNRSKSKSVVKSLVKTTSNDDKKANKE